MKRTILSYLIVALLTICSACKQQASDPAVSFRTLEEGFSRSTPDDVRIAVYWYWISDNISKEGVVHDLEAMKSAGIGRAFIGNIGLDDVPYGDVKLFSEEWWEVLHVALKKATELDIEIGIFNSPGWSQSGGPWVKPRESMRYLSASDIKIEGGQRIKQKLPEIPADAEDVLVLGYLLPEGKQEFVEVRRTIRKKEGQPLTVDLPLEGQAAIRSLIFTPQAKTKTNAELFVKEGSIYHPLTKIAIDRSNASLNVGFVPYAPIVIALPETRTSSFRLIFSEEGEVDAEVTLTPRPLVERYAEKTLAKMFQTPLPMWGDYLWLPQPEVPDSLCVSPDRVLDLTDKISADGMLEWDAPEGNWIISRLSMRSTGVTNSPASPEGVGLEIDKLSRHHVATHFDAFIGEILRRIPPDDRRSFKVIVADSYEMGGQNWTDDMIHHFEAACGYSPVPYLPVLSGVVVGSRDISDRFLWDLRRLIADRVAVEYVGGLREMAHRLGLTTWLENYGHWGFPGEFLQYGGQSDEVSGEFWSEGSLGDIENRAASSSAHIYGKRRVWAESCTSGGPAFSRYPAVMKQRVDRFFTEGINSTLLHVYIHQPFEDRKPGLSAWFGNEFNRKNTWFSQLDIFTDYLKRCNFLLQQGLYVADVAYFIGEDVPKMTGICDPPLPQGYAFDYINAEVLLTRVTVKNGCLTLPDGMQYRLLVLPPLETMRPEVLRKISDLVHDGLTITGPAPTRSPSLADYPKADAEIAKIASALWGTSNQPMRVVGKGRVYAAQTSLDSLLGVLSLPPDFVADTSAVLFIHRTLPQGDIYFLSNQREQMVTFSPTFRVTGKIPEWWDPLTGEIRPLPEFVTDETTTKIPVTLQGYGSGFVIFRTDSSAATSATAVPNKNFPDPKTLLTLTAPWEVEFEQGRGGTANAMIFPTLEDWAQSPNDSIRYFSGTACYRTTFPLDFLPHGRTYLDAGKVMVMARITLNGQSMGGVWTPPYRVNITAALRKGENTLEVEVANNWMNALIGDERLPESERKTWTNKQTWESDSPLQSSGLLGPVEIYGE